MPEKGRTIPHDTATLPLEEIGRLADGTVSIAGQLRTSWLDEFGHEDLLDLALIEASDTVDPDPRIDRHMVAGRRVKSHLPARHGPLVTAARLKHRYAPPLSRITTDCAVRENVKSKDLTPMGCGYATKLMASTRRRPLLHHPYRLGRVLDDLDVSFGSLARRLAASASAPGGGQKLLALRRGSGGGPKTRIPAIQIFSAPGRRCGGKITKLCQWGMLKLR